ncbi:MAG: NAD(P)H-dependent oxidoreductase subunit E [Nitrospirae bacterium]|nr:NAD(P)H-dependent oxidoreductase subunit E [Nitrospirota bacterium]
MDTQALDEIIDGVPEVKGNVIAILHAVQTHYNYLPKDVLRYVSKRINVPITRLYSIATFYHFFSLKPKGKHQICVCLGTACHVKGAERVLSEAERVLGIKEGDSTSDMNFSLGAVRCIGACSLAPVVTVDSDVFGGVAPKKVAGIFKKYE